MLPLHALAAALSERRVATRVLGARVPRDALASAIRRSGPAAVFLWSALPRTGSTDQLAGLPAVRPAPQLVLGGPGWQGGLPAGAVATHSLAEAVEQIAAASVV